MKIIITEKQKVLLFENKQNNSLINMIKEDGWKFAADMVGGIENLKKVVGIESPMGFLHLFDDLDVFQSEENPNWIVYYEKGNYMITHNRKNNNTSINYIRIWEFLEEGFGLDYNEIQEVMKEWLFEVYNLRVETLIQPLV
jgi:hypothetical protein